MTDELAAPPASIRLIYFLGKMEEKISSFFQICLKSKIMQE